MIEIAGLLEEQRNIPMVRAQLPLIADVQADGEWWQDVTLAMLEDVRRKLRSLVRLITTGATATLLYTDFTDELGDEHVVDILGVTPTTAHGSVPGEGPSVSSASTKTMWPSTG